MTYPVQSHEDRSYYPDRVSSKDDDTDVPDADFLLSASRLAFKSALSTSSMGEAGPLCFVLQPSSLILIIVDPKERKRSTTSRAEIDHVHVDVLSRNIIARIFSILSKQLHCQHSTTPGAKCIAFGDRSDAAVNGIFDLTINFHDHGDLMLSRARTNIVSPDSNLIREIDSDERFKIQNNLVRTLHRNPAAGATLLWPKQFQVLFCLLGRRCRVLLLRLVVSGSFAACSRGSGVWTRRLANIRWAVGSALARLA